MHANEIERLIQQARREVAEDILQEYEDVIRAFSDSTDWDAIDAEWQDALFVVGETMRAKYLE